MVVTASRTGPPYWPECRAWSSTSMRASTWTTPRSEVVSAGTPTLQFEESATMMTSASRRSRWAARKASKEGEPTSSSPSM